MPESKNNEEDDKKKPSGIVKDGNKGHDSNGDEENDPTLPPKQGIGDMPPIELSNRKKVESSDKETHPPRIPDGMKNNVVCLRNLTNDESLNEGKKQRVCQSESPFFELRRGQSLKV